MDRTRTLWSNEGWVASDRSLRYGEASFLLLSTWNNRAFDKWIICFSNQILNKEYSLETPLDNLIEIYLLSYK